MEATVRDIGKFMEQHTGIKPESVGQNSWIRAIRRRMQALGMEKPRAYLQKVTATNSEFLELVELIVVPETWFFRERSALDFLATFAKSREDQEPGKIWNILSMACASGEESYSIAMVLVDAGIPPAHFSIEGVDISKRALATAKAGVYGSNSFRSKATLMHKRHFDQTEKGYAVHPGIKSRVKFFQANITTPQFAVGRRKYDVIFCRNVLIYFNSPIQKQVFDVCEQLLTDDGLIFYGPTESELARLAGFAALGPRNACAFHRREGLRKASWRDKVADLGLRDAAAEREAPAVAIKAQTAIQGPVNAKHEFLQKAERLADEGQIEESIELCNKFVEHYGANADAYYLLGALHLEARNDERASSFLQKALYLSPNHYDTLVNLALIAERQGNAEQAELFWRRAKKQFAEEEGYD